MSDFEKEFDDILGDLVKKNKSVTYVCFVMDHSGSMKDERKMAMNSFNEQLKTLKKESDDIQTLVSIIEFDFTIKPINKNKLVEDIEPLEDYWIGGTTAYYDAIACGISTIRELMDKDPREDKAALMLIHSDGMENASQDYAGSDGQKRIQKLIKELEDTGKWTFTFLAEGVDKELVANFSKMSLGNTMSYNKDIAGYKKSLASTQRGINQYFSARKLGETQILNFHDQSDCNINQGDSRKDDEEYTPTMQREGFINAKNDS